MRIQDDAQSDVVDDDPSDIEFAVPDSVSLHRRPSVYGASSEDPLLLQEASDLRKPEGTAQKLYIIPEDLTIVLTGFTTSKVGYGIYVAGCILSLGAFWLLCRWFPRWRVRLIGKLVALGHSDWVAVEVWPGRNIRKVLTHVEPMERVQRAQHTMPYLWKVAVYCLW